MMELLQRVLRSVHLGEDTIDYGTSKELAASRRPADRRRVAKNTGVRPEVLYYLAADTDPSVRAAVASNEATPVQADLLLARDRDDVVRADLAHKIARLTPGLSAEAQDRLQQMTYEVLQILVRDQVTHVRQVIAETIKDFADAPPEIVRLLARDCEIVVARPILEFSPLLSDEDLLEIITASPIDGALTAIARRAIVREPIADAISATLDKDAITALLANPSAQIREETLDHLVDRAAPVPAWHKPLVQRPRLSAAVARKLARFVATNLLALLSDRRDLDPAVTRELSDAVMRRLAEEEGEAPAAAAKSASTKGEADKAQVPEALARAQRLKAKGQLDEKAVLAALASDKNFAYAAIAVLADLPIEVIGRVLSAHSPKGVTALAWKSGLSMRAAVKLQLQLGQIPPGATLHPRADGGYPLSEEAMLWQLEFFGGMGARS